MLYSIILMKIPEPSKLMNKLLKKSSPNQAEPIILAIDTSCDDTSVAVLRGREVLASIISSQVEIHKKWGGVVPDIARRAHKENIDKTYLEALKRAKISEEEIEFVAVTYGPGLAIALEVGLEFAKNLAYTKKKKLVPINHMEGHLLASLILNRNGQGKIKTKKDAQIFPALALLISGNHTEIIYVQDFNDYKILGETLDDAAGEAFDKVARMMNIGYPGGPILTLLAGRADKKWSDIKLGLKERDERKPINEVAGRLGLPVPMMRSGDLNFSFSGLKTACLYKIEALRQKYKNDKAWSYELSREFISAVSKSLSHKLNKALKLHPEAKAIILGGGVSNNRYIVRDIGSLARKNNKKYFIPEIRFRSDNAGMIGIAAYYNITNKKYWLTGKAILKVDRKPMLKL